MRVHHTQTIQNLTQAVREQPEILAVILAGSVARGTEKEFSDIDAYIIVTDEEYAARKARGDLFYWRDDVCTYPGGYIDGKIISLDFIQQAAEKGSEPTRASFLGAQVVYSTIPELDRIVGRIAVYPEEQRTAKIRSFYSQVRLYADYFLGEGLHKNNPYLVEKSIVELVFFASRLLLAQDRILFPGHKDLFQVMVKAGKPEDFIQRSLELLQYKDADRAREYTQLWDTYVQERSGDILEGVNTVTTFLEDIEWDWFRGTNSLENS